MLVCHRRDAWQLPAIGIADAGGVTDHEYFGMAGYGKIGLDQDAAACVPLGGEPAAGRRGHDASCPDYGAGFDTMAGYDGAVLVDVVDIDTGPDFDPELRKGVSGISGQGLGKARQDTWASLQQNDAGLAWVDVAEVAG